MNQQKKVIGTLAIFVAAILLVRECGHVTRLTSGLKSKFLMMGSLGEIPTAPVQEAPVQEPIAVAEEPVTVKEVPKVLKKRRPRLASNAPIATNSVLETVSVQKASDSDIQIGVDGTGGFVAPTLRFEYALTPTSVVGVHFSYTRNFFANPEATLWGGGVSYSYYLLGRAFSGLSVDGEFSTYDIKAQTAYRASHITPSALAAKLTWHGSIVQNFNYAVGAGPQFVHLWGKDKGDIIYQQWVPAFRVSLGYDF